MWILKNFEIADYERGFLYEGRKFSRILDPGRHRFFDPLNRIRVEVHDTTVSEFRHRLARFLMRTYPRETGRYLQGCEFADNQLGLIYMDGQLVDIALPGSYRVYWRAPVQVRVETLTPAAPESIPDALLKVLLDANSALDPGLLASVFFPVEVVENHLGLLYVDGRLHQALTPGRYGFWKSRHRFALKLIDLRTQTLEVNGQEILTRDRVSLRINLSCSYRVADAEKAVGQVADYKAQLYRDLQLILRKWVGTRSLDQLLEDKDGLGQDITRGIEPAAVEYGLETTRMGVRDIILPGDMKNILNQVVEAEKAAEANLIRRREETAATRSLHNTAKVMEGNPVLLRLKELEVLEKVTERIDTISVYGGLDSVLNDLVRIAPQSRP